MSQSREARGRRHPNPRREALVQACCALREKKETLFSDQITMVELEYIEIIKSLEAEIIEIDRRGVVQ